jgi:Spy/CpxP family protein refolding chaperone
MTKSIFAAGALAVAIAVGSPASAMPGGACGRGAFLGGRRVLHALDLTADQKQKLHQIWTAHRQTLRPLVATEKAAREALVEKLLADGAVSQQDLDPLVQAESQARAALAHERLALALDARNVLTPAQLQKVATIHTGMKQLCAQMRALVGTPAAS